MESSEGKVQWHVRIHGNNFVPCGHWDSKSWIAAWIVVNDCECPNVQTCSSEALFVERCVSRFSSVCCAGGGVWRPPSILGRMFTKLQAHQLCAELNQAVAWSTQWSTGSLGCLWKLLKRNPISKLFLLNLRMNVTDLYAITLPLESWRRCFILCGCCRSDVLKWLRAGQQGHCVAEGPKCRQWNQVPGNPLGLGGTPTGTRATP